MRLALSLICLTLGTLPVAAQSWTGDVIDNGTFVFGYAADPGRSLVFSCNAPSARNLPAVQTESHEVSANAALGLFVEPGPAIAPDPNLSDPLAARLDSFTIRVDGTAYRLPPLIFDELDGTWRVELTMADPLIVALSGAGDLVVDPGLGQGWSYSTDGLEAAIDRTMRACIDRWAALGHTIPTALNRYWPVVNEGPVAPQPTGRMPPRVDAHIRQGCSGGYSVAPGRDPGSADFDRDGAQDIILDWADITCNGPLSRPFCGAANCSIDVFLSTRPNQRPEGFLGVGYSVVTAPNGLPGLQFGGTAGACERGDCDYVFWWNGTEFQR